MISVGELRPPGSETEPARDGAVKTGPLDVDLSVQNTVASP